jgi:predicted transcriptional regulator
MKPFWKTSEFWTTLITNVVGMSVLCGAINTQEGEEIGNALKSIAGAVISLVTTMGYIRSRTELKKTQMEAVASLKQPEATAALIKGL